MGQRVGRTREQTRQQWQMKDDPLCLQATGWLLQVAAYWGAWQWAMDLVVLKQFGLIAVRKSRVEPETLDEVIYLAEDHLVACLWPDSRPSHPFFWGPPISQAWKPGIFPSQVFLNMSSVLAPVWPVSLFPGLPPLFVLSLLQVYCNPQPVFNQVLGATITWKREDGKRNTNIKIHKSFARENNCAWKWANKKKNHISNHT